MTSAQSSRQKLGRKLINASAVLGLLYLFAPIVVIVLFSFNEPKGKYNIVWQ
jgi:spermidine/putrescine transport system permease protein